MFNNKTILITGATGSFGKALIKFLLKKHKLKKIVVFSRDEVKQFEMQQSKQFDSKVMRYLIGDVRDFDRLNLAMDGVDFVVHAAALKQVPTAEYNPFEVVKTNVIGAQNVIDACFNNNVKKVVALSTDKAASPINLYGATKLTSDKLFVAANNYKGLRKTIFSVVRYGNVMNSRGSVLPLFLKQAEEGILKITHKKMTRFNINLDEGVNFVIKSFKRMLGGEIFVPKIPSFKIVDLANAIDSKIKKEFTGIRPGEKLHEEMISSSDSLNSLEFKDYYIIVPKSEFANWNVKKYTRINKEKKFKKLTEGFTYNSLNNSSYLNIKDLKLLVKKNKDD